MCEVAEWEETRNWSKSAMKWRNMSEMSLTTTIDPESNPFILFSLKQWCIEVFWTHQFIGMVLELRFGKVGWSSSSKSGSQGGGLVENDDEHYETIDQMNSIEIFIHWSSNPDYITKNDYKDLSQPSSHQGLSYPSFQKQKWSENGWFFREFRVGCMRWCGVVKNRSSWSMNVQKMSWKVPRSCPYAISANLP